MKRISLAMFCLMVFTSMSNLVYHDLENSHEEGNSSSDYNEGNNGKITAMYGDVGGPAITDENGGMGFGCLVLCSPGEWAAFILIIAIVVVASYWIFRKIWMFVKRRMGGENSFLDLSYGGGSEVGNGFSSEKSQNKISHNGSKRWEEKFERFQKERSMTEEQKKEMRNKKLEKWKNESLIFSGFVVMALIIVFFGFDGFSSH
jgi:hypothetical protein